MMKKISLLISVLFFGVTVGLGQQFIYQDGRVLRDSTKQMVKLKGVNLGGWLLWEGWIWGGGLTKESKMTQGISTILGQAEVSSLRDYVYHNFITERDIEAIGRTKMNVVRVPFHHKIFDTAYFENGGFTLLDSLVKWCKKNGVYVVLDLHAAPGGQNALFISDPEKKNLWANPGYQSATVSLWRKIAEHYKNEPTVAGYDILNEPAISGKKGNLQLLSLYDDIIKAIREVDTNHLLIIEGNNFAKNFEMFIRTPDNNMVFSFHYYNFLGGNPSSKIPEYVRLSERLDVPVWCGEWGENTYEQLDATLKVLANPADSISGWCFWTWKKVQNKHPALYRMHPTIEWINLMKWTAFQPANNMPTHDDSKKGMQQFKQDMLYHRCTADPRLWEILKYDL